MPFNKLITKLEKISPEVVLILLVWVVYANSLAGEFLYLDDVPGFVDNSVIKSLSTAAKTLNINTILYAFSYRFFGLNPVPLHVMSVLFHTLNVLLGFYFLKKFFSKKIAFFSTALFAAHPVNAEVVAWISGRQYMYILFFLLVLLNLLVKGKEAKNETYFWYVVALYSFFVVIYQNPRMLLIPPALYLLDAGILARKYKPQKASNYLAFVFPLMLLGLMLFPSLSERVSNYTVVGGANVLNTNAVPQHINEESFMPVLESYPYTIYSMLKYYLFPFRLTVYHDGGSITGIEYLLMFAVFALFVQWLFRLASKKDWRGYTLLLLIWFLLPSLSPIKLVWFFTERYLYFGNLFFCLLLIEGSLRFFKKRSWVFSLNLLFIILLTLYGYLTTDRNKDWRSELALAEATVEVVPKNPKAYNNLGSAHYRNEKNAQLAIENYTRALEVHRGDEIAINNLGIVLLESGPSVFHMLHLQDIDQNKYFEDGLFEYENELYAKSMYHLVSIELEGERELIRLNLIGEMYLRDGRPAFAEELFTQALSLDPTYGRTLLNSAFAAINLKNYTSAQDHIDAYKNLFGEDEYTNTLETMLIESMEVAG